MVTVKNFALILALCVQGSVSKPQDATEVTTPAPPAPPAPTVKVDNAYDYYDKQYEDYGKQYDDYVKQYIDYVATYGDYTTQQYVDYVTQQYVDYGHYDYAWQYGDDYGDLDNDYGLHEYGEYFAFGDRNNPYDTVVSLFDDNGMMTNGSQMPWVYIIVPVIQIDVFYVDPDHEYIEDVEMQLPIETFFFELGDFGMGHFDLGDFGLGDLGFDDYHQHTDDMLDYSGTYDDYPLYGHYQGDKAQLYASGEELNDFATLDYPGIDHENPYWIDWIFMVPPDDPLPPVPAPVNR